MSKTNKTKKENEMPTVMDQINERIEKPEAVVKQSNADQQPEVQQPTAEPKQAEKPSPAVRHHQVKIPLVTEDVPTFRLHIDVNLAGTQAVSLRRLAIALDMQQAVLENGRRCINANDAVRWMLEQFAGNP